MSGTLTSSTTTIRPIYRLKRVLYGVANNLEQILGLDPLNDVKATLNNKYNIEPATIPSVHPTLGYFGLGNKGKRNIDTDNLSQPQEINALNMDIYGPMPLRCVPIEQDLTPTERASYAMRRIMTIKSSTGSSQQYVAYYLKRVTKANTTVQFFNLDSNGNQQSYSPDYSYLNPTPPSATIDGTTSDVGSEINAVSVITVNATGVELSEAINVLYNGDGRYGTISEVGLYTGTDKSVTATDYQGNTFSYQEAILAQLHTHYTFNGFDMSTPNAVYNEQFSFGSGRVILL